MTNNTNRYKMENCFSSFARLWLDDGQCVTENREWLDPSLCNSLVLSIKFTASSSSQNARTGQICCLFSTSKVWKAFSFRGFAPWPPPGALPPDPRYRLALAMAGPLQWWATTSCLDALTISAASKDASRWPPIITTAGMTGAVFMESLFRLPNGSWIS